MRLFNASGLVDLLDHLAEDKITKRAAPKEDAHFTLRRYNETRRFDPERVFHFAFVGDSRVRLLFTAFYKVRIRVVGLNAT